MARVTGSNRTTWSPVAALIPPSPKLLRITMNINTDEKKFSYKFQSIQTGKGAFIVMDVFTECKKQIIEDRVKGRNL